MKKSLFLLIAFTAMLWSCSTKQTIVSGHIVDVVNQRIYDGEITIENGKIASIREVAVPEDAAYILPGFTDSHIHIESTLMLPENYVRLAVMQGTIAVISDPHEVANVLDVQGIEMMLASARKARFHFHFGMPSCVPATGFETSGAEVSHDEVAALMNDPMIYGLGEVMNVPGVLNHDSALMAKIGATLAAGKLVDGHAPGLSGEALKNYIAAGISDDHEATTMAEAEEKIAAGMMIQIREGSAACDLDALYTLFLHHGDSVMFCSDDKYPDETINLGYINESVSRCIQRGMPLWNVLTAACVTPVRHYNLQHGLLQKGDPADFILVDNLTEFGVTETWIDGYCVYRNGEPTDALMLDTVPSFRSADECPNHFLARPITEEQIRVKAEGKNLKVIGSTDGSLITSKMIVKPIVKNGYVETDTVQDVLKLVCYSRHSVAEPVVAFIHGFSLKNGAIASTIGHDSHNIIALGTNDDDIVRAINHLVETKGGMVICAGDSLKDIPLPVAGLMSLEQGPVLAEQHIELKAMAHNLGCTYKAPFMTLAFMPLPVIPELKITDLGLFDATTFQFTSIWEK